MTYKKFYYHSSNQKELAEIEKIEEMECAKPHEDEYYIWNEESKRYHEAAIEYWI
jgi:hypothetical protein|nr:MAG TPA: hypothetical protein [Bacteriophage sp.]